ncbi:MAG: alpha/beta hydrolase [Desulfohalobiaceae bacterium]
MSRTILMIHGMWGGGWYWDRFQSFFQTMGYNCIAPDLRHHDVHPGGAPPSGLGQTSLLDYARDLEATIKGFEEKPILMGHSMGGLLAQMLASRGLAEATVLISPAPPAGIISFSWSQIKSFSEVLFRWKFWKKAHQVSYEKAVYATMQKLPTTEREYIYNRCVWESGWALTEIAFWFLGLKGAWVNSEYVTCPVLTVAGSDDRIITAKTSRKVARRYKYVSTYLELGDHAHWIIREPGWEKAAAYIQAWIQENTE